MEKGMNKAAFPRKSNGWGTEFDGQDGMLLLDYFAGQALTTFNNKETISEMANETGTNPGAVIAVLAYDLAEHMLKEREKRDVSK